MYLRSGHLPYYAESMFPPMELIEEEEIERKRELSVELEIANEEKRNVNGRMVNQRRRSDRPTADSQQVESLEQEIDRLGDRATTSRR